MSEPVSNCPLCGNPDSTPFDQRSFRGLPVTNRLCSTCGLVYQSPRMAGKELDAFYAEQYRSLYQGSEGPNPKDLAVQGARAEALYGFARAHIERIARHLDIGSSAGALLQRFQRAFTCQVVGIEPGNAYRQYARQLGLSVYASLEELHSAGEPLFDLVSLAHVLEHLPDPLAYLAELRAGLLAPNGWLLLEVPNLYAHDCFEIAHLVSYSPATLRQTLGKAGFEVIALQAHGRPRSLWVPLYITALARPATASTPFVLQAERYVALKRRLGLLSRAVIARLFPRLAWRPVAEHEQEDGATDRV